MSRSDDNLAAAIAASLRASYQAELDARANPPPPRPVAPVPDWLFGPDHRKRDAERLAERERARAAAAAPPPASEPSAPRPTCPCCLRPMPDGEP